MKKWVKNADFRKYRITVCYVNHRVDCTVKWQLLFQEWKGDLFLEVNYIEPVSVKQKLKFKNILVANN